MKQLIFLCLCLLPMSVMGVSIVSDSYPETGVQPTHCRLMFSEPIGEPDRTEPVEMLADSSVRCRWPVDDLASPGQKLDLNITAVALDQTTGQESAVTSPFSLNVNGSPTSPTTLRLEYN